jgi:hypothetical protein
VLANTLVPRLARPQESAERTKEGEKELIRSIAEEVLRPGGEYSKRRQSFQAVPGEASGRRGGWCDEAASGHSRWWRLDGGGRMAPAKSVDWD